MKHTRNTIWDKRIPSFLGFLFLGISLVTITWLSRNAVLFGIKASVGDTPKNVQISNISDSSFTISYFTDERNTGTVTYGKNQELGSVALDDRDKISNQSRQYRAHVITIQNLEPSTKYFFSILSGTTPYTNSDQPYEVTTAPPARQQPSAQSPVTGKVTLDDGNIPAEAVAFVSSSDSQLYSVLLKPDGSYLIPLSTLRKLDLSSPMQFSPDTVLRLFIVSPQMQSSVSLLASQANPVPLIILSKNYDFTISAEPLQPSPQDSGSAQKGGFPELVDTSIPSTPIITVPGKEEAFTDSQPMFKGKAIPHTDVEITIQSQPTINTTVKADSNGNWEYRPETPLDPGEHMLTIHALDASGIIKTLTQPFTVFAEGSQFVDPSAGPRPSTISPTSTPTPVPVQPTATSIPTIAPTATPIVTPIATPTATLTPSAIPSPLPVTTRQPTGIAKPGSFSLIAGTLTAGIIIAAGALVFFLTVL